MVDTAKKKLGVYRAKRDFTKTAEPSGDLKVSKSPRPRFVIQKHAATRLHYDLRLEHDGIFRSWAVTRGPSLDPHDKRLAVEVEDHPLDYGDFEGTIPKGEYGGGTVQMWDRGFWEPEGGLTPQDALKKGDFKFILYGDKLHGSWALVRMRRRDGEKRDNWLLIKHRDEYAVEGNGDAVLIEDRSVASGRTMAEIAAGKGKKPKPFMLKTQTGADAVWHSNRENGKASREPKATAKPAKAEKPGKLPEGKLAPHMPSFVQPQLCKSVERAPTGAGWGHEIKLDGYRMQIRVEKHKAALRTRKGLDWTEKFSAIAKVASKLPDCIIDGEAVVLDKNGAPSFPLLQIALSEGKPERMVYFAFDLLFANGHDLRDLALRDRKAHLESLLKKAGGAIRYSTHLETSGQSVLEAASKMSLEGIVSKRLDARYKSDRQDTWVKTKCRGGNEVVIGGWTEGAGRFRSLLAGVYKDGKFNYVGRIGTGFGAKVAENLLLTLKDVESASSPFNGTSVPPKDREIHWAKPTLVAEVEFGGITSDNLIRQAAFKGLRDDKPASEVTFESLEPAGNPNMKPSTGAANKPIPLRIVTKGNDQVRGVTISHPEKELWPSAGDDAAVTKRDLVQFYDAMAEEILDHIKGRPCSIIRAPDGITSQQFFQRHAMKGASKLMTFIKVKGDKEPYLQIDTPEALIAAGQISAVELHPWNCQPGEPETPGRLVFDLDPAPDVPFADVVTAAREMHDRLKALGLESFCKTTGGKGLHVVTPFKPEPKLKLEWPAAKAFAQEVCRQMAADSPDRYLINMAKKERVGRIFLDYLRNDRTSTAVAPLSPRARPGAPVSMPVTWAQVRAALDPSRFNTRTAEAQLKKTKAWSDYEKGARPFTAAAKKLIAKAR